MTTGVLNRLAALLAMLSCLSHVSGQETRCAQPLALPCLREPVPRLSPKRTRLFSLLRKRQTGSSKFPGNGFSCDQNEALNQQLRVGQGTITRQEVGANLVYQPNGLLRIICARL